MRKRKIIEDPVWICLECGNRYGRRSSGVATWHEDMCDICGKIAAVTEPRDFGYLNDSYLSREYIVIKRNKIREEESY
jgi:hypothetical protein